MKKLITLLMTLCLNIMLFGQQTVTVTANNDDIANGLDLKVVAKLFAEAPNLEQFEVMLNNPDSMFCNLDINGDGDVDYLRVVEVGEGSKHLVVLQAVLAKDIYQDVASIYVEKDEKTKEISVQIIGDEYVYGTNYIIEPVYIYRPVIYDWFWGPFWYAWRSPYYWGYYPAWWHYHRCWHYDRYWHHCYAFHRHHHHCSFHHGHTPHPHYHDMYRPVSHHDYADHHRGTSFRERNEGVSNAHYLRSGASTRTATRPQSSDYRPTTRQTNTNPTVSRQSGSSQRSGQQGVSRTSISQTTTRTRGSVSSRPTQSTQTRSSSSSSQSHQRSGSSQPTRSGGSYSGGSSRSSGSVSRGGGSPSRSSGSPSPRSGGSVSRGGGAHSSRR